MSERKLIEDRLRKKEQEVRSYEEKIREAKIYVQALRDILKMMDRAVEVEISPDTTLKPGSMIAQAREAIIKRGAPIHLDDLLDALGKEITRESKASLAGSIAAYVRRNEIFTRPAPSTFGLIELGHETAEDEADEPPASFGTLQASMPTEDIDDEIPF
jgi:hypothetical protein